MGTDLEPEKALAVQVKHISAEPRSPGAGILRCHERETRPAVGEQAEEQTVPRNSVSFSRITEVITPSNQSFTRLIDHDSIRNEPLWVVS